MIHIQWGGVFQPLVNKQLMLPHRILATVVSKNSVGESTHVSVCS
jgi:hypothetical protein